MDKPAIDLEKLKEFQNKKNEQKTKESVPYSLTDPYYSRFWRRGLINVNDFDELE